MKLVPILLLIKRLIRLLVAFRPMIGMSFRCLLGRWVVFWMFSAISLKVARTGSGAFLSCMQVASLARKNTPMLRMGGFISDYETYQGEGGNQYFV